MAKFQVPTVGGIRKVIKPSATVSNATTIAGLEGTTLTLAQLSQLLATLDKNTGGGNIGTGAEAAISVGPGLAGGGPLVGVVNIRLTAPLGALGIVEDGADGNDGPPGPPGKSGAAGATGGVGPSGPAVFFLADDGGDGDLGPPGPPGPLGQTGATGTTGSTGAQGPIGPGLFFLADDGQDGDNGPPGAAGVAGATGLAGAQGPIGPALFMLADDGADGDLGPPGPRGATGTTGSVGPAGPAGPAIHLIADEYSDDQGVIPPVPMNVGPFTVNGTLLVQGAAAIPFMVGGQVYTGGLTANFNNTSTVSGDFVRYNLVAGSEAFAIFLSNQNQAGAIVSGGPTTPQACMRTLGAIPIVFGTNNTYAGQITTLGQYIAVGAVSVRGVTPAVTASQTDLGITTTATVITTAGGIALPALASTFWRVNVNGVAYGIPCFAL